MIENESILGWNVKKQKTAVVLFQLGGPDSPEAVEPFLYNLFMDPDIIDFPLAFLARRPLAAFISRKRSVKVRENYRQVGGKSPIFELTKRQADSMEAVLAARGIDAKVFIAMRYWHPFTDEVVRNVRAGGFTHLILLPLYPQYSRATTYSSVNEWNRKVGEDGLAIPTGFVCCYPNHPKFIAAFVDRINEALNKFEHVEKGEIDLVFSAHGVPVSYIKKGDPYQLQVEETVRQVAALGSWGIRHTLCYQSKVGPMEWLRPSLVETVERLAREGRKYFLIVPVAFVTDHIETLHEINIDVRKHAQALGVRQFEMAPAINDHPKFIECLADLVVDRIATDRPMDTCRILWNREKGRRIPKNCPWMR
jgi:ferrochelatase